MGVGCGMGFSSVDTHGTHVEGMSFPCVHSASWKRVTGLHNINHWPSIKISSLLSFRIMNQIHPPAKRRRKGMLLMEGDAALTDTIIQRRVEVKKGGKVQKKLVQIAFPPPAPENQTPGPSHGDMQFVPNFDDMPLDDWEDVPPPPRKSKACSSNNASPYSFKLIVCRPRKTTCRNT